MTCPRCYGTGCTNCEGSGTVAVGVGAEDCMSNYALHTQCFQIGDVITLDNVPGMGGVRWRVNDIVAGRGVKLVLADEPDGSFNNMVSDHWIVGPGDVGGSGTIAGGR